MTEVKNMTNLFKRELMIYSIFDMKLRKPARLMSIFYFFLLFLPLGIPFLMIVGISGWSLAISVGIPAVAAHFMSQPIWEGKSFPDYVKTRIKYLKGPKYYYDLKPGGELKSHYVDSQILVSRKRDFAIAAQLEKKAREGLQDE